MFRWNKMCRWNKIERTIVTRVSRLIATASAALALVALSGLAAPAAMAASPLLVVDAQALSFGFVAIGQQSPEQTVTFTNVGDADLTIGQVSWPEVPFSVPTTDCFSNTLAPGASCMATVAFAPTAAGSFTDDLIFNTDGGAVTIPIDGTSGASVPAGPSLSVSPTALDFGPITVGQSSATLAVLLTNQGAAPVTDLAVGAISNAAFTLSTDCSATLAPAATCTVTFGFSPTAAGSVGDSVTISGATTQADITLLGSGIAASVPQTATPAVVPVAAESGQPQLAATGVAPLSFLPPAVLILLGVFLLRGRSLRSAAARD